MASSSVLKVDTAKTGPKTSSVQICMWGFTFASTVGARKYPFFKCCNRYKSHQCGLMNAPQPVTLLCTFETWTDTFKLQENSQGLFMREVKARRKEPSHRREGASYTCLFTLIHFTLQISTWELSRLTKQLPKKRQEASNIFCNMRFHAIKFKVVTLFPSQMWNSLDKLLI